LALPQSWKVFPKDGLALPKGWKVSPKDGLALPKGWKGYGVGLVVFIVDLVWF